MGQIRGLVPFKRDDSLQSLFFEHRKAWTRDILNKWMAKKDTKWSDIKDDSAKEWIKRGWDTEPYSTDDNFLEFWEYSTRSSKRKQQRPHKRHVPKNTLSLVAGEELAKFQPHVKTESLPKATGLRSPTKVKKLGQRARKSVLIDLAYDDSGPKEDCSDLGKITKVSLPKNYSRVRAVNELSEIKDRSSARIVSFLNDYVFFEMPLNYYYVFKICFHITTYHM